MHRLKTIGDTACHAAIELDQLSLNRDTDTRNLEEIATWFLNGIIGHDSEFIIISRKALVACGEFSLTESKLEVLIPKTCEVYGLIKANLAAFEKPESHREYLRLEFCRQLCVKLSEQADLLIASYG